MPQPGGSVTQYVAFRFTSDAAVLLEAARRGSVCAQIFLDACGRGWR